jgi:DNA-binding MarR family transcriptional regulator
MAADPKPDDGDMGLDAWRSFLRAHSQLIADLDAEMQAAEHTPIGDYDVFAQLARAPERRMRMCELAEAVVLSPSGLSRRVERLERRGLVGRRRSASDGRSVEAGLTPEGAKLFRRLRRVHHDGIQRHFSSQFSDSELETLGPLLARLSPG